MKVKVTHATGALEYKICIDLQLQRGLGKGLSSLANITLKSVNKIDTQRIENKRCKNCRPKLVFDNPEHRIVLTGGIEKDVNNCLMTSEHVKMMDPAGQRRQI